MKRLSIVAGCCVCYNEDYKLAAFVDDFSFYDAVDNFVDVGFVAVLNRFVSTSYGCPRDHGPLIVLRE